MAMMWAGAIALSHLVSGRYGEIDKLPNNISGRYDEVNKDSDRVDAYGLRVVQSGRNISAQCSGCEWTTARGGRLIHDMSSSWRR